MWCSCVMLWLQAPTVEGLLIHSKQELFSLILPSHSPVSAHFTPGEYLLVWTLSRRSWKKWWSRTTPRSTVRTKRKRPVRTIKLQPRRALHQWLQNPRKRKSNSFQISLFIQSYCTDVAVWRWPLEADFDGSCLTLRIDAVFFFYLQTFHSSKEAHMTSFIPVFYAFFVYISYLHFTGITIYLHHAKKYSVTSENH